MYENLAAFAHCNNTTGFLNNVIQHYTKTYNFVTLDAFLPVQVLFVGQLPQSFSLHTCIKVSIACTAFS